MQIQWEWKKIPAGTFYGTVQIQIEYLWYLEIGILIFSHYLYHDIHFSLA